MNELADRPLRVADETILLHCWRIVLWFINLRAVPRWREHSARLLTRIYRRYFYDGLTRPGKIIVICSLLIFLFSYQANSDLLLITAAFGTALMLWTLMLGYSYRPRISVQRTTQSYAIAGQPLQSSVLISNKSARTLHNFTVREQATPFGLWPKEWLRPHQLALAPQQHTSMTLEFVPLKRGVLQLTGVVAQSYFPFFLTRFTQHIDSPVTVNVLPATFPARIPSLRHIADVASKRLTLGVDNARSGPSLEYAYSRQYQTGDSLRRLDHRASSRQGKPMSKVFQGADEIRRDQVYVVVDLRLQDFERWQRRPRDESKLDQRLALAVEIGLSAQNEGFSLNAIACGDVWHELDGIPQFYRHIAAAKPARAHSSEGAALPETVLSDMGVHVLVVGRWSDDTKSLVERWQQQGILVLVFLLPETAADTGTLPIGPQFIEIAPDSTDQLQSMHEAHY